jgi:zinc protease
VNHSLVLHALRPYKGLMTFQNRASTVLSFVAAAFVVSTTAFAQDVLPLSQPVYDVPEPKALQSEDETPWLYEGSNVPVDREWLFGKMDNGLRYAVRRNGVPPNQVSIRVRIDAGSLHEEDNEQGYAHLLEHLLFRESTHLGQAKAIAAWQRLGATFGADTNAETSFTHTAYKLEIPDISPSKLDESFKLLSGMIKGPVLNDANVAAELPIVLAEKRERGGAAERVGKLSRSIYFAGQRLVDRDPIGTEETLTAASGATVKAFYDRWYRPENTVIAVAGDADPKVLAGLVEEWFGDWQPTGPAGVAPDFGDPVAPEGAGMMPGIAAPLGEIAVVVEPDLSRRLTFVIARPWRQVQDTIVYNEGKIIDDVAMMIVNRRIEQRARNGGAYVTGGVGNSPVSRSAHLTSVAVSPISDDWQTALAEVRGIVADAIANPPTQAEIDREASELEVGYVNFLEQARVQSGRALTDSLIGAVDIRETVASPQVFLDVFQSARPRMTPDEVHKRTRALFTGNVVRSVYVTPSIGEADKDSLKLALASEAKVDDTARLAAAEISFDELPPVGAPGTIISQGPLGILDVQKVEFANGAKALLWANDAEPGRVTVRVRFGSGYRAFDESNALYAQLGTAALMRSGIGELGLNELELLATGRKLGLDFGIDDAAFTFTAQSRSDDVADQLYLFAAKLGMPRWDPRPVERVTRLAQLGYNSYSTSPDAVLARDLEYILTNNDPRFVTPTPEMLEGATPEEFRKVWEPLLAQGPVEVLIFGEFDQAAIIEKLRLTFGALPERKPIPAEVAARVPSFPMASAEAKVLTHRGDPDQAAAVVAWPSGAGLAGVRESRQLAILVEIFSNRLLEALREEAGASYAPQAFSNWPEEINGGGRIVAISQLKPEFVPIFFAEAERIANELAVTPPTLDDISRATEPLGQRVRRASTGNQFWLYNLEGASSDPTRIELLRSMLVDYSQTSPRVMQILAQKYFAGVNPVKLAVIPEGQELAQAPEVQRLPTPSVPVVPVAPSVGQAAGR